tara:strand:- start:4656 stop:5333 length:678 start_codon:yes stop_codon:yes gene_type:complete
MHEYIKKAANKAKQKSKEQYLFHAPVYVVHELPENINLPLVLEKLEALLPKSFCQAIDAIYISHLEEFDERSVNAMYKDGAIYVTNRQDDALDLIDDVVHEVAHAVEEFAKDNIYSDGLIEREFLAKRNTLYRILHEEGYAPSPMLFQNPEYSEDMDTYLHQFVGYPTLISLSMGLFVSPYAITSLREYFACAFEEYFLGDRTYVKKISTQVYNKIERIKEEGDF